MTGWNGTGGGTSIGGNGSSGSRIDGIEIVPAATEVSPAEKVIVTVSFSLRGDIRDSFNEEAWTDAYEKNDNIFKLKYGVKLVTGGLRKRELGSVDAYRKASIFWTRNPKLVNPMKDKRVWVQVSKNFIPYIRLTEEDVRSELFDFKEEFAVKASDMGDGRHKLGAEIHASWQKHEFTAPGHVKASASDAEVVVGN